MIFLGFLKTFSEWCKILLRRPEKKILNVKKFWKNSWIFISIRYQILSLLFCKIKVLDIFNMDQFFHIPVTPHSSYLNISENWTISITFQNFEKSYQIFKNIGKFTWIKKINKFIWNKKRMSKKKFIGLL